MARRDPYPPAALRQCAHDVAAEEAGPAEHGHDLLVGSTHRHLLLPPISLRPAAAGTASLGADRAVVQEPFRPAARAQAYIQARGAVPEAGRGGRSGRVEGRARRTRTPTSEERR